MNVLRFLTLAALATVVAATPALAQRGPRMGPGAGPRGPQRRGTMMFQGITLTPTQQAQIDSIHARFVAERPAMRSGVRPDSAMRAQRWAQADQRAATMRAVLTPEQQVVWDRNLQQMRANRPRRPW